jgi:hypothetical protein
VSTPFGPDDTSVLDEDVVRGHTAKARAGLRIAQDRLTRLREAGPDPRVRELTRAEGLWPFLLVRNHPGDAGSRPLPPGTPVDTSPDIIVTQAGLADEPRVVDRDGLEALAGRAVVRLWSGLRYDLWVHVWNLGRSPATGVRVRAHLWHQKNPNPRGDYLGGTAISLGDRAGRQAHRAVKAATFIPPVLPWHPSHGSVLLIVTVDCLTDPAQPDATPADDRHTARHSIDLSWLSRVP